MAKGRVPMQVDFSFEETIKRLQSDIMRQEGKNISMRELTAKIIKTAEFKRVEEAILKKSNTDINIALDRRRR